MDPRSLLKDLVRIPSVNPMGRNISGPDYLETRLSDALEKLLLGRGLPCERVEVAPGRSNLLSRIDFGSAVTVLMDAHQDTVPVDGMTIAPFDPVERDGRIYGRGSCDVKGGMASMLSAFFRLADERPAGCANVVMSLSVDEEATSIGIDHLTRAWVEGGAAYQLLPEKPTYAIVAEPTGLDAVVAHRGVVRWRIRTAGRACHSSKPEEGISAIYRMAKVVCVLENYARELPSRRPPHRLCGPATLSVGLISGGSSVNIVPDSCVIDIDRRTIPGEDLAGVIPAVMDYLTQHCDVPAEADPPFLNSNALSDAINGPWAGHLLESVSHIDGPHKSLGVAYGTHASRLEQAGIPSVVLGPGDIAQAHTKDEWIAIDQLRKAADVYYRACTFARLP